jgi:DNA-binding NarL/FixJ family response regulator
MSEQPAGPRLRVLLVDDHPVVRAGIAGMLAAESDIEVVGEASDGREAVAQVAALHPDVVLMDLRMPHLDGAAATEQVVSRHPSVHVVVLTTYDTDGDIVRAVEAGATGYLLKDATRQQLAEAVRAAGRGETVLAAPVAATLMRRMRDPEPEPLTPREREVLTLVGEGLTNVEIGRRLHIAEATVKTHLLRVFAKLGVDDRTRAVMLAHQRGLLA